MADHNYWIEIRFFDFVNNMWKSMWKKKPLNKTGSQVLVDEQQKRFEKGLSPLRNAKSITKGKDAPDAPKS